MTLKKVLTGPQNVCMNRLPEHIRILSYIYYQSYCLPIKVFPVFKGKFRGENTSWFHMRELKNDKKYFLFYAKIWQVS